MRKKIFSCVTTLLLALSAIAEENQKVKINAIGIPLADHYAGIVALEKYGKEMKYADYSLKLFPGPKLVRAYFLNSPDIDVAFNVCPMVIDMFAKNGGFKWVGLLHRDGNALAINNVLNSKAKLEEDRALRKPDAKVADAFSSCRKEFSRPVEIAIPSTLSTHTTILYKYLKDNNKTFTLSHYKKNADVYLKTMEPPKSPVYLKKNDVLGNPAAFGQSLPWAEIVETGNYGKVAWYSKDVMKHKNGHVECIIIAKNETIKNKRKALQEVIDYIHKAGKDIEKARQKGGDSLGVIIKMIQKHIPAHTREAIINSLNPKLMAINYKNLDINKETKESLRAIMDLAYEAGFITEKIDIDALADESFSKMGKEE